jgi:hypothetical protein
MENLIDLKVNTASNPEEVPEKIVQFLEKGFDFINNREDFLFFYKKYTDSPFINWIEYNNKPAGYYSLLVIPFSYRNDVIKSGKPELNLISGEFIKFCNDNKIDYKTINPMRLLHNTVLNQAVDLGLKFLFTWPNAIAQPTYTKNNYSFRNINITIFTKVLDYRYFKGKTSNKIFIQTAKMFNIFFKIKNPFRNKLEFIHVDKLETNKFDIEAYWNDFCKKSGYDLYPYKTNEIINKRFSEKKFDKYLIRKNDDIIGYIILKDKTDNKNIKYLWIADYFIPEKYLFSMLDSIYSKDHHAVQCRFFSSSNYPKNKFKMIFSGFIFKTCQIKKFNYLVLDKNLEDPAELKIKIDDYLTDFSL